MVPAAKEDWYRISWAETMVMPFPETLKCGLKGGGGIGIISNPCYSHGSALLLSSLFGSETQGWGKLNHLP